MKYTFAFIVLNYNGGIETERFVNEFLDWKLPDFCLILIDNNSPNKDAQKFSSLYKEKSNIILIQSPINGGYSKGNNLGLKMCLDMGIDFAIISNSDVIIGKYTALSLLDFLVNNKEVLLSCPKILDFNLKPVSLPQLTPPTVLDFLFSRKNPNSQNLSVSQNPQLIYSFSGSCFAVNIKNFQKLGFFDSNVFLYYEELILSEKARDYNIPIFYLPMLEVKHLQGHSTGKNNSFVDIQLIKSGLYYWKLYRRKSRLPILIYSFLFRVKFFLKSIRRKDKLISTLNSNKLLKKYVKSLLKS
jgi:GT2 family glycosyltransferase